MVTLGLVDDDEELTRQLVEAEWPMPVEIRRQSATEARADLVVWNMSRYPAPIDAVVSAHGSIDGDRAVLIVWDEAPRPDGVILALRLGALDARAKAGTGRSEIVQAARRFFCRRQVDLAEAALLDDLIERSYRASIVNGLLGGINQATSLEGLFAGTQEYFLEVSGAIGCAMTFGDRLVLHATDGTLEPSWIEFVRLGSPGGTRLELEQTSEHVMASLSLRAAEQEVGTLYLFGPTSMRGSFEAVGRTLESLGGQVAIAAANLLRQAEIEHRADHDGLTGLYNRAYFERSLLTEFDRATRYQRELSVLLLDVDRFKHLNDTYGHPAGDRVLQQIASCLQISLRLSDQSARYGGEEFVVLLPETPLAKARLVAERIRRTVQRLPPTCLPEGLEVTVSLGAAAMTPEDVHPREVVARADQALYQAKRDGRNRVCLAECPAVVTLPSGQT
jgi:diguanylate cyclase (GGDEF)-like protein